MEILELFELFELLKSVSTVSEEKGGEYVSGVMKSNATVSSNCTLLGVGWSIPILDPYTSYHTLCLCLPVVLALALAFVLCVGVLDVVVLQLVFVRSAL